MKIIRKIIGSIILFFNAVFSPKSVERQAAEQLRIDELTAQLALYQFHGCPFCVKVRRTIKRLSLNIKIRDIKIHQAYQEELISQGGKRQVPCLKITTDDGQVSWLYESSAIVKYLHNLVSLDVAQS